MDRRQAPRRVATMLLTTLVIGTLASPASAYPRPGQTERVSIRSDSSQGNSASSSPAMSADGRFVAFASVAYNLVPQDTNATRDIFVHDRHRGTTERVSISSGGVQANGPSYNPAISADGRHVAFESTATNLAPGDGNQLS
ncbi:MAG TPA: hypothetical protein VM638_09045, partial [Actinomycetota bacterium]|nr:hypothetical protein [Actinomycetota bacterium]